MGFLIPRRPLTNFELEMYYRNEPRFNGVFSRNNLPKKIKDGAYIININMQMYAHIGWRYFVTKITSFILTVLMLNIFLKKFKNLLIVIRPLLRKMKT